MICPHCRGNHWKEDCPKKERQTTEAANLLSENFEDESEDMLESACIASDMNEEKK